MSAYTPSFEVRFKELIDANQLQIKYLTIPKLQKVANVLRNRKDFEQHYSPKLVSFGPIHHGRQDLQLGEKYKLKWAAKFIQNSFCSPENLYKRVVDNIEELKTLFADDVLAGLSCKGFSSLEEKLSWMLFVDGCSLLYILDIETIEEEENVKVDKVFLVFGDVLLFENQLPYPLLKLFLPHDKEEQNKSALIQKMVSFLLYFCFKKVDHFYPQHSPIHLLDLLRQMLLLKSTHKFQNMHVRMNVKKNEYDSMSVGKYMNVQELRENGINVILKKGRGIDIDISFSHGWLKGILMLPEIILNDVTVPTFLNLIAYEMCKDFKNNYEIGSYLAFMDSLIRQPEDVKDLRSTGILHSNLGSDEELVKLFHFLATDLVPNPGTYFGVRFEINKHVTNKFKTNFVHFLTLISHPWTNVAVHATEFALALAFVQTLFTIHPLKFN